MMTWANIFVIGLILLLCAGGLLFFIGMGILSYRRMHRKQTPPPESGTTWSNNAIRKQGKEGKGIR